MEKHRIDKNDLDLVEKFEKAAEEVEKIYEKLFSLELEGKTNSKEYKNLLGNLRKTVAAERALYQTSDLDFARADAIAHFILSNRAPEDFKKDLPSIVRQEYDGRIERRILGTLVRKNEADSAGLAQHLPEEIKEVFTMMGAMFGMDEDTNARKIQESILHCNTVTDAVQNDTYSGFLTVLREFINDPKYAKFREPLLRSKYFSAYINSTVEDSLLDNGFEIPDTFYSSAVLASNVTGTPEFLLDLVKDRYGFPLAVESIGDLLLTSDRKLSDYREATTAILRQCVLRSVLMFLSKGAIDKLKRDYQELVDEDDDYKRMYPNGQKSEELIKDCFDAIDRDRLKQATLSFGFKPTEE